MRAAVLVADGVARPILHVSQLAALLGLVAPARNPDVDSLRGQVT